jgi:hypothetical protein
MAQIRSKKDAEAFMETFSHSAQWDEIGEKWYLVLTDKERGGNWTLMHYPVGAWTLHGKGETYCDSAETPLTPEEACAFVWKNRAAINRSILSLSIA